MKNLSNYLLVLIVSLTVLGCSSKSKQAENILTIDPEEYIATPFEHARLLNKQCFLDQSKSRNIAIFFDGTSNAESSETNIVKLRNLATMQKMTTDGCPRNYVLYVKGVGTEGNKFTRAIGGAFGYGIGKDVRQAYRYLAQYYRGPQDNIYIFGFSRGAASARILNSFVSIAGLPNFNNSMGAISKEQSITLYDMYKGNRLIEEKRKAFAEFEDTKHYQHPEISFLGLFDTVSALGITHFGEGKAQLNRHYSESICKVKRIAHAVSIDDNRASSFTPALLHKGLLELCPDRQDTFLDFVDQVWFAGAHADVGGGYLDTDLSGIALNWMVERVNYADSLRNCVSDNKTSTNTGLFEYESSTYADYFGLAHDAESQMKAATNRPRDWPKMLNEYTSQKTDKVLKSKRYVDAGIEAPLLHPSAIKRLSVKPKACRDFNWIADTDGYSTNYKQCFRKKQVMDMDSISGFSYCTNENHKPIYVLELKNADEIPEGLVCPSTWMPKSLPANCVN